MDLRRPFSLWKVPHWPVNGQGDASPRGPHLPLVLLYHSIEKLAVDPWGVRVRPRNFLEHMAVIRAHCQPMRLAEVDAALRSGTIPPRAVVVTFDDGYVDNLTKALPAMRRYDVPGTVFVSSGYVGSPTEYWWDELDRLLLQPGNLPRTITLNVAGNDMTWKLDDDANYSSLAALRRRRNRWFAYEAAHTPRQRMFQELWAVLRAAPSVAERERVIEDLRRQARPAVSPRPTHRCCTVDQLRQLAHGGLIEIGAHTINHPSLGHIGLDEQQREIDGSKRALEQMLQTPVTSFSYPFGTRIDYVPGTIDLLKKAGIERCCSNFEGPVVPSVDRYQYPRVVVQDWTGERFLQALERWFARYGVAAAA